METFIDPDDVHARVLSSIDLLAILISSIVDDESNTTRIFLVSRHFNSAHQRAREISVPYWRRTQHPPPRNNPLPLRMERPTSAQLEAHASTRHPSYLHTGFGSECCFVASTKMPSRCTPARSASTGQLHAPPRKPLTGSSSAGHLSAQRLATASSALHTSTIAWGVEHCGAWGQSVEGGTANQRREGLYLALTRFTRDTRRDLRGPPGNVSPGKGDRERAGRSARCGAVGGANMRRACEPRS